MNVVVQVPQVVYHGENRITTYQSGLKGIKELLVIYCQNNVKQKLLQLQSTLPQSNLLGLKK